jgi:hypothetical protein
MLDEYARFRGLDATGGPSPMTWARLADPSILDVAGEPGVLERGLGQPASDPRVDSLVRARGRVALCCHGPLAAELGSRDAGDPVHVELELPATLAQVLAAAARDRPRAARHLLDGDRPVPAAYRSSRRLMPEDRIESGDVIDLVVALTGGRSLS